MMRTSLEHDALLRDEAAALADVEQRKAALALELERVAGELESAQKIQEQDALELDCLRTQLSSASKKITRLLDAQCSQADESTRLARRVSELELELDGSRESVRCQEDANDQLAMRMARAERDLDNAREVARSQTKEKEQFQASLVRAERELESARSQVELHQRLAENVPHCESKLRSLMTDPVASSEQITEAIGAVEAFLGEARREAASKQLRERRAAFERLHDAAEGCDEDTLVEAISVARRSHLDADDIEKGESKLAELRARTDEERNAKDLRDRRSKAKEQAFLFVKRDQAQALSEMLTNLDANLRWQEWKDHAGRTLLDCARERRSEEVHLYLAALLEKNLVAEPMSLSQPESLAKTQSPILRHSGTTTIQRITKVEVDVPKFPLCSPPTRKLCLASPRLANAEARHRKKEVGHGDGDTTERQLNVACTPSPEGGLRRRDVSIARGAFTVSKTQSLPAFTPVLEQRRKEAEELELRTQAFRAVAQDSVEVLESVLSRIPSDVWSGWCNKAGKGLLSLAQERGSTSAYSRLAQALGLLKEMKTEAYEEREDVWVFLPGEVQPRRATVLVATPEASTTVRIEYWDGDCPSTCIEKSLVRKMCC